MPPLVIFGLGSVARLAYSCATHELGLDVLAFAVDSASRTDSELFGLPVVDAESLAQNFSPESASIFVAVGYRSMLKRASAWQRFADAGWHTPTLVSPRAYVAETSIIGHNCFVMAGAVIEPGACLGDNNLIWSNSTICHDCRIGSHNFFASNTTIGGDVSIGDRSFFGFSSTILQQRSVGSDVVIAAAALVTQDATGLGRYIGIPARRDTDIDPTIGVCIS